MERDQEEVPNIKSLIEGEKKQGEKKKTDLRKKEREREREGHGWWRRKDGGGKATLAVCL